MLLELYIENYVLIDKLNIEFSNGLNIITGETGSGKSLIFQAIRFVMGEKLGKEIIRIGTEKALVKAVFTIEANTLLQGKLQEYGIDVEDGILIVEREISSNGRSISRINSKPIVVSVIKELRKIIIDIHSQHEQQGLLDSSNHLTYLDNFIGSNIETIKESTKQKYSDYRKICESIEQMKQDAKDRERNIDMFRFQLDEIDGAKLKTGEEEALFSKRNILSNALNINEKLNFCYNSLSGPNENGLQVLDELSEIVDNMQSISSIDSKINDIKKSIEDSYYVLQECKEEIRSYMDTIEYNEEELSYIHERIDLISRLKRKYGEDIKGILEYREEVSNKLSALLNFEEEIDRLQLDKEGIEEELRILCEKLSAYREKYARNLENGIKKQLAELEMKNVDFKVKIERNNMNSSGWDKIEFLISTNKGEPLKSISKIVSGGELSRIMLAVKIILSKADATDTMLFDEIDAGISGGTAWAVSQKLGKLSKCKQIFSITHLPQIASMSDRHILVRKKVFSGTTVSIAEPLDYEKKCYEVARLIDGSSYNAMNLEHSKQMIDTCISLKQ